MNIGFLKIYRKDLLTAFDNYKDFTNKGYEKIPYSNWQRLKSAITNLNYKYFHFYFNEKKTIYIAFDIDDNAVFSGSFEFASPNQNFLTYIFNESTVHHERIFDIFHWPRDANTYHPFLDWADAANIGVITYQSAFILTKIYQSFFHCPSDFHRLDSLTKDWLLRADLSYSQLLDSATYEMEDGEVVINPGGVIHFKNKEYIKIEKEERNKDNMNTSLFKNFSFGPLTDNTKVKLSMYGLAVQNSTGTWVAYDKAQNRIVDVDILSFDANEYLYVMPVALNQVAVGDTVIHNRVPVIVTEVAPNGATINVVDPMAGESKVIMPTRSPFGFDFISKVINLLGGFLGDSLGASADAPFGNMLLPLLLSSNESGNLKDVLPLLMLGNGGKGVNTQAMLPFLLFSGNNKSIDPMTLLLASGALGNANPFAAPAASK